MTENLPQRVETSLSTVRDPMGALVAAIDRGLDADTLEKLAGLVERFEDRRAEREFNVALTAFHRACPLITKNKSSKKATDDGTRFGYMFATLDHIVETILPHLDDNGFCYTFDTVSDEKWLKVTCTLRHIAGHSVSATFESPPDPGTMNIIQKRGSAQSYAMRYSLIQVLGLTTCDEDNDGAGEPTRPPECVTEQQAADLRALAEEVGADGPEFLRWLHAPSFELIPARSFEKALAGLERKRGGK